MKKRKSILLVLCLFLFITGQAQVSKTINVTTPGTLSTLLTATELSTVTHLTVIGNIDARDFKTIRDQLYVLNTLDIKDINIAAYNGLAGTNGNVSDNPVNAIPEYAFYNKNSLTSIRLPESATSIQPWCFYNNTGITSITIPLSMKTIGEYAFQDCSKLTSIIIDNATVVIGGSAFYKCIALSDVRLGNNVVSIGNASFSTCTSLTSFTVPPSVKTLGTWTFSNCTGLKNIDILASVTELPEYIFDQCTNLTDIKLPATLVTVQQLAFRDCWLLRSVVFPNSLKTIKTNAFLNCKAITELDIPNSVNTIGSGAFYGCISLKTLTIPCSVSNLDAYTFYNCIVLETINVKSYQPISTIPTDYYNSIKVFENVDKTKCILNVPYKAKKHYQVADQWKDFQNIVENEFGVSTDTLKLNISPNEGVRGEIGLSSNSSWTVSSDKSWLVVSPLSGINDGKITFVAGRNDSIGTRVAKVLLTDAAGIPQKIEIIQNGKQIQIDLNAGKLTKYFTNSEKSLVNNLKLTGTMNPIDFKLIRDSLPALNTLDLSGVKISAYQGNAGTSQDYNYNYAADEIPDYAFYTNIGGIGKSSLVSLILPLKLNSIRKLAFSKCSGLSEMYIPKSVKIIESQAFDGCTGLKKIMVSNRIPVPLTFNGYDQSVFSNIDKNTCQLIIPYNTKQLYLNASVWKDFTNISEYPSYLFLSLDTLRINSKTGNTISLGIQSNVSWTASPDSTWLKFKTSTGVNNDSLTLIADPNPNMAPRATTVRLTSLQLEPECFTIIQDGQTVSMKVVAGTLITAIPTEIKKNVTNLVLTGTMYARDFTVIRDSMPDLIKIDLSKVRILANTDTIQSGYYYWFESHPAKEIPMNAFKRDVNLESSKILSSVILPDTTVTIGEAAFSGCTGLNELKINGQTTTIKNNAFDGCKRLEYFDIPETVKSIGAGLFDDCTNLKSVTINAPITTIPGSMFNTCTNLLTLKLPNTIRSVGSYAFYGCSKLKEISLPLLTSIGEAGFIYCTGLTEFHIPSTVTSIGEWGFAGCVNMKKIYADGTNPALITLGYNVFSNIPTSTCTLNVPIGSKPLYVAAEQWKNFMNIEEITTGTKSMNESNIRVITERGKLIILNAEFGNIAQVYNISGIKITEQTIKNNQINILLPTGIYLLRVGNFSDKILIK
jgi:hypothetical protein